MGSSPSLLTLPKEQLPEIPIMSKNICEGFKECPVCMTTTQLINPRCGHGLCKTCIGYICSSQFKLEKKCPLCRTYYSHAEISTHALFCTDNNLADNLEKLIKKLIDRDSKWITPITFLEKSIPPQDLNIQLSAIDDMYNGKISYAQMRMLAG